MNFQFPALKNVREEIVWEIEIDMYALVYLQWITNKDLL